MSYAESSQSNVDKIIFYYTCHTLLLSFIQSSHNMYNIPFTRGLHSTPTFSSPSDDKKPQYVL